MFYLLQVLFKNFNKFHLIAVMHFIIIDSKVGLTIPSGGQIAKLSLVIFPTIIAYIQ
jgi:hypothetical protein